jgi:heptosyltransferase II
LRRIDPLESRRLLIRGTNWVGDAVMSVPALKLIRKIFPNAHISLLVRPWVKDIYSGVDFVDAVLEVDKEHVHRGMRGIRLLAAELRNMRFDTAILLQNAFEAAYLAWAAGIPIRLGYSRDSRRLFLTHPARRAPELQNLHQAYYYLGILWAAGLTSVPPWKDPECRPSLRIPVRATDRSKAVQILRDHGIAPGERIVGLNPGAYYGGAKRWLSERYAQVAEALIEKSGIRIVLLGSAQERLISDEIAGNMKYKPTVLAGRTSLGELMGLIEQCTLLITNDSGPMHIAAALDTPQIAIFGSTSDMATGPLSRVARVLREPVDCSPCFLRECPIDLRCMKAVTVDCVLREAEAQLRQSERVFEP